MQYQYQITNILINLILLSCLYYLSYLNTFISDSKDSNQPQQNTLFISVAFNKYLSPDYAILMALTMPQKQS